VGGARLRSREGREGARRGAGQGQGGLPQEHRQQAGGAEAVPCGVIEKMSKELLLVVDAVAHEKGVPESVILEALEAALATAAKKRYLEQDVLTRVAIDSKDGNYETFRRWEVVADDVVMESPDRQIRMMDAIDEAEGVE